MDRTRIAMLAVVLLATAALAGCTGQDDTMPGNDDGGTDSDDGGTGNGGGDAGVHVAESRAYSPSYDEPDRTWAVAGFVENPTDKWVEATVTVTAYDANGSALDTRTSEPFPDASPGEETPFDVVFRFLEGTPVNYTAEVTSTTEVQEQPGRDRLTVTSREVRNRQGLSDYTWGNGTLSYSGSETIEDVRVNVAFLDADGALVGVGGSTPTDPSSLDDGESADYSVRLTPPAEDPSKADSIRVWTYGYYPGS
jgi:hypothetical protein